MEVDTVATPDIRAIVQKARDELAGVIVSVTQVLTAIAVRSRAIPDLNF